MFSGGGKGGAATSISGRREKRDFGFNLTEPMPGPESFPISRDAAPVSGYPNTEIHDASRFDIPGNPQLLRKSIP
jgi:hypothetical protein